MRESKLSSSFAITIGGEENYLRIIKQPFGDGVDLEFSENHNNTLIGLSFEQLIEFETLLRDAVNLKVGHYKGYVVQMVPFTVSKQLELTTTIGGDMKQLYTIVEVGGCEVNLLNEEYDKLLNALSGVIAIIRKVGNDNGK